MDNIFLNALVNARNEAKYRRYYASSYKDNIYPAEMNSTHIGMFCNGEGKELLPKDGKKEKGACIYSSSMLSYNFFHWIDDNHTLAFDGLEYDRVVFEEQFRVLKNRNNRANLDVVLVSKDRKTILLFESKFTEHLKLAPVVIAPSYDWANSYYPCPNGVYYSNGEKWVSIIKALRNKMEEFPNAVYYEGLKQVACHLVGISNVILNESARTWFNENSWLNKLYEIKLDGNETFIFKSIVFHPSSEQAGVLSKNYEESNRNFVSDINFLPFNIKLDNPIITYWNLWKMGLEESVKDPKLKDYLYNYLKAHEQSSAQLDCLLP